MFGVLAHFTQRKTYLFKGAQKLLKKEMAFKMLKIKSAQMKRSFVFEEFIYEYLLSLKENYVNDTSFQCRNVRMNIYIFFSLSSQPIIETKT